jgi:hypothetical protein
VAISATVNELYQTVVYAIAAQDHSLWEFNPQFNPNGADHWLQVSAAPFAAISAMPAITSGDVAAGQSAVRKPVVYGIMELDHSLWENSFAINPSAGNNLTAQWAELSTDAWAAISASAMGDSGSAIYGTPRTLQPVVYAIRASDRTLWQFGSGSLVSPGNFVSISATVSEQSFSNTSSRNYQPVVYGVVNGTLNLWEHNPAFNPGAIDPNTQWLEVSPGSFAAISATHANGAPVVFGIVTGDHSLWENNPAFNPTAGSLNGQWGLVSPGAFSTLSASTNNVLVDGPIVYATLASDGSLWENNPQFNPQGASLNDHWMELSPAAWTAISGTTGPVVYGTMTTDATLWEYNPQINPFGSTADHWLELPSAF